MIKIAVAIGRFTCIGLHRCDHITIKAVIHGIPESAVVIRAQMMDMQIITEHLDDHISIGIGRRILG